MEDHKATIYILSDQKLRGEIIQNQLKINLPKSFGISLLGSDNIATIPTDGYRPILIIDFIALNKTPKHILSILKNANADIKIIGMHLYRTMPLVTPLFDMGIDGYVYYEPSRDELIAAIHSVIENKNYMPPFLGTK